MPSASPPSRRAGQRRAARSAVTLALGALGALAGSQGCGSGSDFAAVSGPPVSPGGDLAPTDAGQVPDATVDGAVPAPTATTPKPPRPPTLPRPPNASCTPSEETCNGKDDDCDGKVDEDLPPVPCPGGGERYCVAGRMSACPVRCETCLPGSERVCLLSYCTFWATETCAADGRSFGVCREAHVPPECEEIGSKYKDSRELEQCCIDQGYCCKDEYDLDHDGSRSDMVGACDEVLCSP